MEVVKRNKARQRYVLYYTNGMEYLLQVGVWEREENDLTFIPDIVAPT
jgi:hypothetical protein